MATITAKVKIYVQKEQGERLQMTTNAYRQAWNFLSEKVVESKELNQINLNNLYYKELRNRFGLKSQMAQSVMKTVIARYKSAKSNGHECCFVKDKD
ncbi:helix-turn-helix domain-containing protein [Planococcus sp. YIM B11945]|uniref:helix-turn-helix domain-containing protein n=1 Tax=Planococcus sp. YIM B11945 TaxID=3435410 RepID=UPI003D7CC9C0